MSDRVKFWKNIPWDTTNPQMVYVRAGVLQCVAPAHPAAGEWLPIEQRTGEGEMVLAQREAGMVDFIPDHHLTERYIAFAHIYPKEE